MDERLVDAMGGSPSVTPPVLGVRTEGVRPLTGRTLNSDPPQTPFRTSVSGHTLRVETVATGIHYSINPRNSESNE